MHGEFTIKLQCIRNGKVNSRLIQKSGQFISHKFYLENLFHTLDLEQAKYDMITYSRNYYFNDKIQLEKVSYF